MRLKIYFTAAACAISFAAYASAERETAPAPLTEKNAKYLEKTFKDRVAGEPVRCVSSFGNSNLVPVSADLIVYRPSGRIAYKNHLERRCSGLGDNDDDILIFDKSSGSRFCKNDIFRAVDRFSGITTGLCRLGEFTPYRKPKG